MRAIALALALTSLFATLVLACSQASPHPPATDPCPNGSLCTGLPHGGVTPARDATPEDAGTTLFDDGGPLGPPDVDNSDVFSTFD